jgi:hypothetical protein
LFLTIRSYRPILAPQFGFKQDGRALQSAGTKTPFEAVPGTDQKFTINVTGKLNAATQ